MFLHGLRGDCLQKTAAAFRNVPPGGRKITRVPRVGHVAGAGGVVEQTVDFARRERKLLKLMRAKLLEE